jgi:translation initiation factor 6
MMKIYDIEENNFIGVFIRPSDKIVIVPSIIPEADREMMEEVFKVPVIETTIGGTNILGSLIALNSHGAVASNIINNNEFQHLAKQMNLVVLQDRHNALGNSILLSETKALISPFLSRASQQRIENVLDVETLRGTIAGQDNVGMSAVVTTKGLICHPQITEEEKELIDDFFGMRSTTSTVNFGIPLVGAGLCANSHGALIGGKTTGVEMNRIENALDLI